MAGEGKGSEPALITMTVSHYSEKARWALDRYGIPYKEVATFPGFHYSALKSAGGKSTVPCLRLATPDPEYGQAISESADILRWVDRTVQNRSNPDKPALPPLFPTDIEPEVSRLCQLFDSKLGPAVRSWAYSHTLYLDSTREALVAHPVSAFERTLANWGAWYIIRSAMAKSMKTTPENGQLALQEIKSVFSEVDKLLADGRPFLTGPTLTAADLTFASLAASAVGQPYGSFTEEGMAKRPEPMRKEAEELRGTNVGQLVLKLYKEHRKEVLKQ